MEASLYIKGTCLEVPRVCHGKSVPLAANLKTALPSKNNTPHVPCWARRDGEPPAPGSAGQSQDSGGFGPAVSQELILGVNFFFFFAVHPDASQKLCRSLGQGSPPSSFSSPAYLGSHRHSNNFAKRTKNMPGLVVLNQGQYALTFTWPLPASPAAELSGFPWRAGHVSVFADGVSHHCHIAPCEAATLLFSPEISLLLQAFVPMSLPLWSIPGTFRVDSFVLGTHYL